MKKVVENNSDKSCDNSDLSSKRFPNYFQFFQNEELRRKIKIREVLA